MFEINFLNVILIGLIFLSLVVIIGILGRNIKKIKEFEVVDEKGALSGSSQKKGRVKRFFGGLWDMVKYVFITFAEWIVKHAKKLLHLVHFWLIKLRRGKKGNETLSEIEAKEELINEEEKNLNKVIHDDLGRADEEEVLEKKVLEENRENKVESQEKLAEEEKKRTSESKIKSFFLRKQNKEILDNTDAIKEGEVSEQEDDLQFEQNEEKENLEKEQKEGLAKRAFGKLSFFGKKRKEKGEEEDIEDVDGKNVEENFSDGVVKIEKPKLQPDEELLMKEVVVSGHRQNKTDLDDELGVDRKILEKKILQKISNDPKNVEHYRQLGELYIKMKNFSDAEDTYKFILETSPRDADAKRKTEKIKLLKRLG